MTFTTRVKQWQHAVCVIACDMLIERKRYTKHCWVINKIKYVTIAQIIRGHPVDTVLRLNKVRVEIVGWKFSSVEVCFL